MEKHYKPVPDMECLKYKGTPEKPDIKIFVSHRIDQDSETIDNPLYIPVRCGAVYDERENVTMLGDDTGDNISEKRMSFCEYTVMYWAWKNIKADYYGLCHYRRYLSFLNEDLKGPALKQGLLDSMSNATLNKCGLLDEKEIRRQIEQADILAPYEYSLKDAYSDCVSIKEFWLKNHLSYMKDEHFDLMLELIQKHAPLYYDSATEYLQGSNFIGFNCFIMKEKYFHEMCEFMFPILFEFDEQINKEHFSETQNRAVGYLGEWLFSIYLYHSRKEKIKKIEERQIVAFQNTEKSHPLEPAFPENNIPVVLTLTDTNRPFVGVLLQSILAHVNPNYNYDFVLLLRSYDEDKWGTYLRKSEDQSLKRLVENVENASLRFYDPKDELLSIEVREWGEASTEEFYYSLLIPWILKKYDKAIYLQEFVIVESDLSELFSTDVTESYAAAVKSIYFAAMLNGYAPGFKKKCEKKLQLADLYDYVSTDVLVLNLEKIRSDYSCEEVLETIEKRKLENIPTDGFNILFEGKINFLPQKWNKIDCFSPEYFRLIEYFPSEEYHQQNEPPKILNLRGISGQWLPQQSYPIKRFWHYARMTEFYEQILLSTVPNWSWPIFDLQCRVGVFDTRSGARKIADKLLPKGSYRRKFAKCLLPKGSLRWRFCKQIYYIFKPQYRPTKITDETEEEE